MLPSKCETRNIILYWNCQHGKGSQWYWATPWDERDVIISYSVPRILVTVDWSWYKDILVRDSINKHKGCVTVADNFYYLFWYMTVVIPGRFRRSHNAVPSATVDHQSLYTRWVVSVTSSPDFSLLFAFKRIASLVPCSLVYERKSTLIFSLVVLQLWCVSRSTYVA